MLSKLNHERLPGREHIPLYSRRFIVLRIIQLILAVVIVGLSAYAVSVAAFSGNCLMLFTSSASMVALVYLLVADRAAPRIYNYWAVLGLEVFLVLFYLVSFGLLASQTAYYFAYGVGSYSYYYGYYYSYDLSGTTLIWASVLAAASGLAGILFALFVVSLVLHSLAMHRHRRAGLGCRPMASGVAPVVAPLTSVGAAANGGPAPASHAQMYQAVPSQEAGVPSYMQQTTAYAPQALHPQLYSPPPQQQQQQTQQPQQPTVQSVQAVPAMSATFYPQREQTPLSAHHTGGSYVMPPPAMPANAYEVPNNQVSRQ